MEGWAVDQFLSTLCQTREFGVNSVVKIGVNADLDAGRVEGVGTLRPTFLKGHIHD